MKCINCGFDIKQDFQCCPNCGAPKSVEQPIVEQPPVVEPISLNPAADKILCALKDNLFFAICILMTLGCVLLIADRDLPLINILITIFLWLTYSSAKKGIADANQLRSISGVVYANYVITNVVCGILIICGVLVGLLFSLMVNTNDVIDTIMFELNKIGLDFADFPQQLIVLAGWAVGIAFIIIAAIVLVVNLLGMRKIHRLAKSVYQSIMYQNPNFENPRGAKGWLVFFGICAGIMTLFSIATGLVTALVSACSASAAIISAILVHKYLVLQQNNTW